METMGETNPMKLPEPTPLTDAQYVANLRIVVTAILNRLPEFPDTLQGIRDDNLGIIVHSQGVELIRRADLVDLATEELMGEIEDELGGNAET